MCREELTRGVCAIDLETFVFARELLDEAEIVKCGGHIEEFRVEAQFPLTTLLSREQVDADRVIKEQIGGMLAQDVCSLFREQRIGMTKAWRVFGMVIAVFFSRVAVGIGRSHVGARAQLRGLIDQLAPTARTIFPFG